MPDPVIRGYIPMTHFPGVGRHRASAPPATFLCDQPMPGAKGSSAPWRCTRAAGHPGAHLPPLHVHDQPVPQDFTWPAFTNWVCGGVLALVAAAVLVALWVAGLVPW